MLSYHYLLPSLLRTASSPFRCCMRCVASITQPEVTPSESSLPNGSSEDSVKDLPQSEPASVRSNFRAMQQLRHDQAHESLLVQAPSVESAFVVEKECLKFGTVQSMFHYRQNEKDYFLIHMNSKSAVRSMLDACVHPSRDGIVPVRSRLLEASTLQRRSSAATISPLIPEQSITAMQLDKDLLQQNGVSAQMQYLYKSCKIPELGTRLRYFISSQIEEAVSGLFPHCRVYLFGSSVSGFGQHHSDVDMILDFDQVFTEKRPGTANFRFVSKPSAGNDRVQCQRSLELLADNLQYLLPGYTQIQRILLARVPIVKFLHEPSGVRCDLSTTNMSGLVMSNYLYTLGEIDERLRALVVTIRRWANANRLTNAHPGRWITNFTLTILVVFFMQHKKLLPPLSQLPSTPLINRRSLDGPNDDLGQLLAEFFSFYASFNYKSHAISVIDGTIYPKPDFASLYIENPLETELNIARNLSAEELDRVVNSMRTATWILEGAGKDPLLPGIVRLFQEINEKDVPRPKKMGVSVDELFRKSGAAHKYQPDEFAVDNTVKNFSLKSNINTTTPQEKHALRNSRQKFIREKQKPLGTRW
ncbi:poly(A) RNA polymerase, mitochondrial-like [Paramacrobiotus metropolitanus]|uniref:poly(A) RNA polymerase, mitochondrial-like n=1 Tax=Paramacrobiotus metropolitanus TaxID=2943436 RepID=UPI0024463DB8|nr:poly(A) RNA polymerase, mitochondrial-like [Paramacrobiotus metropolitanus]